MRKAADPAPPEVNPMHLKKATIRPVSQPEIKAAWEFKSWGVRVGLGKALLQVSKSYTEVVSLSLAALA